MSRLVDDIIAELPLERQERVHQRAMKMVEDMKNWQKKAYLLIGASGSGKSTVRKKLVEKLADTHTTYTFSLDDLRVKFLTEKKSSKQLETLTEGELYREAFDFANKRGKEFDAFVDKAWKEALNWEAVVIDNTNSSRKTRHRWVEDLKREKFHITMVEIHTPLDVILARQKSRGDKSVPEDVVRSQYMRQEEAMVGVECDALIVVDGTKPWNP